MIELSSLAAFTDAYPHHVARITHRGAEDPLFTVPRLAILAGQLPRSRVLVRDPATKSPRDHDMPAPLLIQGAETLGAEIVLLSIDRDADYDRLIDQTIRPFGALTHAAGAPIEEVETVIVIASPRVSTSQQTAQEALLLLQCRGEQRIDIGEGEDAATVDLPEGTAIYLPPGETYSQHHGDTISVFVQMKLHARPPAPKRHWWQHLLSPKKR